jgi:hypothetical protein
MFSELADALSEPKNRLALYVAHDSSIVRMVAGLGIFPLRWPRLGSEVVIEVRPPLAADDCTHVIYCRSGVIRTGRNLPGCYMTEKSLVLSVGRPLTPSSGS